MSASGISQKEYLKKYLSSGGDDKKKKKKKVKAKPVVTGLRIVDDDVDILNMRPLEDNELELYDLREDAPQIAGIIDERPEEVKNKEKFGSNKWKVVADENDMGVKIIDKSSPRDVTEPGKGHSFREKDDGHLSPARKSRKDAGKTPDSDESPPRKSRRDSFDKSPKDKRSQKHDSDESPPRKSRGDVDNPQMRKCVQSQDSDESPPRRNPKFGSEITGRHKRGQNIIHDVSPSRKSWKYDKNNSTHQSNKRQNYDSDESPPRRKKNSNSVDSSPKVKDSKYDSDASPPRRNRKISPENMQSCKKAQKYDSDESQPWKVKQRNFDSPSYDKSFSKINRRSPSSRSRRDSPQPYRTKGTSRGREERTRRTRSSDSDESPPRRGKGRESLSPTRRGKRRDSISPRRREKDRKMLSRSPSKNRNSEALLRKTTRWGETNNVSGGSYKERSRRNSFQKDFDRYEKRDGKNSSIHKRSESDKSPDGKNKHTMRDDAKKQTLDGRKAGLVGADELKAEIADLRDREKEMFEKMDVNVSGRGAAPVMRDRKTGKKRDLEEEAKEKHAKDEKQAERDAKYMQWGKGLKQVSDKAQKMEEDLYEMSKPLARYADDADLDKYFRDQEREGDPMLAYIRSKSKKEAKNSKPQYEGSFMPNRFGIRPGYRWDGVDRSNGYEKQWFEMQNSKKAVEEEAYKWSTADM